MASRSVVTLTTAPAGTGKSYRRCAHFLLTELLPDTELKHLSNFPIQFEEWEDGKAGLIAVAEKRGVATRDEVLDRIEVIPEEEINKWRDGSTGPWDYFKEKDLGGYHLAIDEIHNFCGKNTKAEIKKKWQEWLGELRHRGARIEFISQHPQKIAKEIRDEAEILLTLVAGETQYDPFFGISMGDWYNLIARFTGKYRPSVYENENRQSASRWSARKQVRFRFEPDLFEVYDSFSTPVQGGKKGKVDQEPWERMSTTKFWVWFLSRNILQLSSRLVPACIVIWAGLFGGGAKMMTFATEQMQQAVATAPATAESGATQNTEDELMKRLVEKFPASKIATNGSVLQDPRRSALPGTTQPQLEVQPEPITEEEILVEIKPWLLVAVTEDSIWFANGEQYNVNEVIDVGPYAKQEVGRVDFARRRVVVGGRVLRLRSLSDQRLRNHALEVIRERREANLRGLLRGSDQAQAATANSRTTDATANNSR